MIAQQNPFAQYRLQNPEKPPEVPKEETPFSQYRLDKSDQEESTIDKITRHGTRGISRIGEQIVGLPGDFRNLMNAVIDPIVEPLLEQGFGKEVTEKRREAQKNSRILPTSRELKSASETASKGYTKAKNEYEKLGDEYIETATNLLGPMNFRKALGLAGLATAAKEGVKISGLGEGTQEAVKFGTLLLGSMFNPKGVKNLYNNYYDEAMKHVPQGSKVSAGPFLHKLDNLEKELRKGLGAKSEEAVLREIAKAKEKINSGSLLVEDLVASKRSLNETMGDPELLKRGRTLLTQVGKAFDDAVKLYHNPEFIKNYRAGNEAFGGFAESKKLSNYISRLIGGKPLNKALFAAGAEVASGHPELLLPTLGGAAVATGAVKSIELMNRIMSNKTLRKYYLNMLVNASKENARGTISSAKKLEEGLDKNHK